MAEYYPLIARAVAGLPQNTDEARHALYERARNVLIAQLRGQTLTLSESELTRERRALDDAIRKVETEVSGRSRSDQTRSAPATVMNQSEKAISQARGSGPTLVQALIRALRKEAAGFIVVIVFFLLTAGLFLLTLDSAFSRAIWGNNRESGLFVLVGLVAFGAAFITVISVFVFLKGVLIGWYRLAKHEQSFETPMGTMHSPASPAQPAVADDTVSAYDQNAPKAVLQDQQHPVQLKTNDLPTPSLRYLPHTVGALGAVIGMIISISIAKGEEVITLTGKLAGLGFMIGYPVGILSRAVIIDWLRSRQLARPPT